MPKQCVVVTNHMIKYIMYAQKHLVCTRHFSSLREGSWDEIIPQAVLVETELTLDLVSWGVISDWYWLLAICHFDFNDDLTQWLQQQSSTRVKQTGVHLQSSKVQERLHTEALHSSQ